LRRDNLGSKAKEHKGWFVDGSATVSCWNRDSYLVRNESGRLVKRRHYDLERLATDVDLQLPAAFQISAFKAS
jgi:hypothetical protein